MSKEWNWRDMISPHWLTPAECVYYYLHRWKKLSKILDVGAGVGRHSLLFTEYGYDVTAFDSSRSGLEVIRERAEEKGVGINLVLGDMRNMPFADASFDAVLAYHSIYHSSQNDLPMIISELNRVVKKGGEVFVTLLSKEDENFVNHKNDRVDENVVMKQDGKNGPLVPHYYVDYDEIYELFGKFEILSCQKLVEYIKGHTLIHYHLRMRKD